MHSTCIFDATLRLCKKLIDTDREIYIDLSLSVLLRRKKKIKSFNSLLFSADRNSLAIKVTHTIYKNLSFDFSEVSSEYSYFFTG